MIYSRTTKSGWTYEFSIDLRQWMLGINIYNFPYPIRNVFVGPLRFGCWKEFATRTVKA